MIKACFEYGPLALWGLMLLAVVRPMKPGWRMGAALSAVLLAASQKFLIYRFLGGDSFVPDLPWLFILLEGWAYSSSMILLVFALLWMCARAALRPFGVVCGAEVSRRVIPVLAVCAAAVAGWGVWEGARIPPVRRVCIKLPGLPKELDGTRFFHLTDIHCSPAARRFRIARIVNRVRIRQPQFVCVTGDLVDGPPERRSFDLEVFKDLKGRCPVYVCAGNHEYYSGYAAWKPVFESFGLTMLDNGHRVLDLPGGRLVVGGVPDPVAERYGFDPPDAAKAFAGAPEDAFRILLQHRPLRPRENADLGVGLQLSGHTHGGAILGFDRFVARMGNNGFVRGLYRVGGMVLYVGSGAGQWAGFPLRLGVPSELTEIVLKRE